MNIFSVFGVIVCLLGLTATFSQEVVDFGAIVMYLVLMVTNIFIISKD